MMPAPMPKLCADHGAYDSKPVGLRPDRVIYWTSCPDCERLAAERKAIEQVERDRISIAVQNAARFDRALRESQIEPRLREADLDGWIGETSAEKQAIKFAREYVRDFAGIASDGRSVAFVGNPGTGKTYLACAIGLDLMREGYSVRYTTVQRAIRRVKATWERETREETEAEAISAFTDPDLLILDEVGVQFGSDFEKQLMFEIIDTRWSRFLPTLLISNLPAKELKKYLGERAIDRLNHNGLGVIAFDWGSRRK